MTQQRRRSILSTNPGYDHVLVVFEVANWDTLQELTETLNTELIAAYLTSNTNGLNQITVLDSITTSVEESSNRYTEIVAKAPGFIIDNITYDVRPSDGGPAHIWDIQMEYYTPPGMFNMLFTTRHSEGSEPTEHECMKSPDVCCLIRMRDKFTEGTYLGEIINATIMQFCTTTGQLTSTAVGRTTQELLATFIQNITYNHTNNIIHFLNPDIVQGVPDASLQHLDIGNGGVIELTIPQSLIDTLLASITQETNRTVYRFAIGMLFFRPTDTPRLIAHVTQTKIEITSFTGLVFTTTSNQDYTFLEFLDVVLYEIHYKPNIDELSRLQLLRVTFMLPQGMKHPTTGLVPPTSIQISTHIEGEQINWINPCYSADLEEDRVGSGLWDFTNGTKEQFLLANDAMCTLNSVNLCQAQNETTLDPQDSTLYTIDIPIGDTVITRQQLDEAQLEGSRYYVKLKMMITALKDITNTSDTSNETNIIMVESQVSTKMEITDDILLQLCVQPINSYLKDTDFVSVSIAIGNELKANTYNPRQEIVVEDITNAPNYRNANILDLGDMYKAVSIIDSLLTIVLTGSDTFFTIHEHSTYSVELDSLIVVHIRNDEKHAALTNLVNNRTAYEEIIDEEGFHQIHIKDEFLNICYDGYLTQQLTESNMVDCVIETAIHNRQTQSNKVHTFSEDMDTNIEWLLWSFGDTPYMRNVAHEFAFRTKERFNINYRYKNARWLIPTYSWPYASTVGLNDKTILFNTFSVNRNS